MNNDQFRRLVLDNPSSKPAQSNSPDASSSSQQQPRKSIGNATPAAGALGSRLRSSIPMTPRALTNVDFARQLAEYRREAQPASKRFKSSAAPKGTKLPSGYQDRAALLRQKEEAEEGGDGGGDVSDLEKRVKALEEMVKLGQIDQATFENLRAEMGVGGDLKSTHMVKGLDWELLRRVKGGEDVDVLEKEGEKGEGKEKEDVADVDEELDRVLGEKGEGVDALSAAPKENKEKKKGVMAQRKSRDEILRELKASRAAAAAEAAKPAEPALGTKFKRIGGESKAEKKRWVEQDENGRRKEILQITDAEGKTKRKVRWLDKPGEVGGGDGPAGLLMPDKDAKPLGMEVPAEVASKAPASAEDDDDDDIFAGVGDDYNPLGDLPDDDDSSDESEDGDKPPKATEPAPATGDTKKPDVTTSRPRNYFSTSTTDEVPEVDRSNPLAKDPTLLAALKRAAALRQSEEAGAADADAGDVDDETALRRKRFLEEARRREALDAMDMDMGFGGSRNDDDEDDEEVVLENEGRGGKKRKRGPKKKKGDKDSVTDVMRVLEGRKKE
ncbi:uncharacterized protein BO88DRAFT_405524 [Aspergillus vadensis CBS 113365]|uniref:RED-like N-terminal domain-containing protein n=1 Tax=Aspergillus vadensis (strain CBS 113365 / IMI 142717 / IBT 24658) TaxID=1448311 RepID=A0A319B9Y7_ASPVC|nr:hypothetical protein BO88DRAFT_405524 [Aspergillus vadensis CBS 113365]PYH68664.1 hypothetical protein BO88DRAFT_405524 [Aspergillus vadensis CBS 113365]